MAFGGLTDQSEGAFVVVIDGGAKHADDDVSADGEHSAGGTLSAARREAALWAEDTMGGSVRICAALLDRELATIEVVR